MGVSTLLLAVMALWIGVGCGLLFWYNRTPRPGTQPLVRRASQWLCLVGDSIQVNLDVTAAGLSETGTDRTAPRWDIVLVIDHSSSMGTGLGSALAEAKQTALNLVRTNPQTFHFALVEFDHTAREVQPLSRYGPELVRAIQNISGGGGTDLAVGLEVAGRCLRTSATPGNQAILLLTDAYGEREAAMMAAQGLKRTNPALRLITIGFGAADMALLRQLAGTPDDCYQAGQLNALLALYGQFGRMMAGRQIHEVQLSERFNATGAWELRAFGELQPARRQLPEGLLLWLLASLEERPTTLHYTLEALYPGWHWIALEPAKLTIKLPDGTPRELSSNCGPRLLVLPRIAAWQLLWPLMNPLFFLLFGRWFYRRRTAPSAAVPVPLSFTEPLLPPRLATPADGADSLALRPSLVIGLGYGGAQSLLHCKRLLWERGRRVDLNRVRFLAVDTASTEFFPNPSLAGLVALTAAERLHLTQPLEALLAELATDESTPYPWLPARQLQAGAVRPDLQRGVGQHRVLSRFAIVSQHSLLEDRLRPLLRAAIQQADTRGIDILLTGTCGGGTASGALLDLCWLLRRLVGELGYSNVSIGLFLSAPLAKEALPTDPRKAQLRQENSQALLLELDRLAGSRDEPVAPSPDLSPVRRWFDRVFCIGPAGLTETQRWSAHSVLYPKVGESLFCWLASEACRNHWQALEIANSRLTQQYDQCFVNRLDLYSYYLYPRTLARYLVVETLRLRLAAQIWSLSGATASVYHWRDHRPENVAAIRARWLDRAYWQGDLPWTFASLDLFEEAVRLQEALLLGAGPGISAGISVLERGGYLQRQRELVRASLKAWVSTTLSTGLDGLCEPRALSAVLHVLQSLTETLNRGILLARHLQIQSNTPLLQDEAGLAAELAAQAVAELEICSAQLQRWDIALGEGTAAVTGLLRHLEGVAGLLQAELERLLTQAFPRLPLRGEQLKTLQDQQGNIAVTELLKRTHWSVLPDGDRFSLQFHLRGTEDCYWTLDDLATTEQIIGLAEALVQTGEWLLPTPPNTWQLAEFRAVGNLAMPTEAPRSSQLNPGASGVYLLQGEASYFKLTPHVPTVTLPAVDHQEARVIGCEQNLSSRLLWDYRAERPLPFIFSEEFYAYRAYEAYCRQRRLMFSPLKPALVGLCRNPERLLAFALTGLGEKRIVSERRGGRQVWVANLGHQSYELAEDTGAPEADFLNVAGAWLRQDEATFYRCRSTAIDKDSLDELLDQIRMHPLVGAIQETELCTQFIAVVHGLLLWDKVIS